MLINGTRYSHSLEFASSLERHASCFTVVDPIYPTVYRDDENFGKWNRPKQLRDKSYITYMTRVKSQLSLFTLLVYSETWNIYICYFFVPSSVGLTLYIPTLLLFLTLPHYCILYLSTIIDFWNFQLHRNIQYIHKYHIPRPPKAL